MFFFPMLQTVENEMQRSAIETIFKMYYGKMVGVAMRVLQNESDAEDAVNFSADFG